MSVRARLARMEQNATTGPMGLNAAVLKVRASIYNSCQWIVVSHYTTQYVPPDTGADDPQTLIWSLLSIQWFGVELFLWVFVAVQTKLRALIPLFPSLALRITGSLSTSSC